MEPYPDLQDRTVMATRLKLKEKQVETWFIQRSLEQETRPRRLQQSARDDNSSATHKALRCQPPIQARSHQRPGVLNQLQAQLLILLPQGATSTVHKELTSFEPLTWSPGLCWHLINPLLNSPWQTSCVLITRRLGPGVGRRQERAMGTSDTGYMQSVSDFLPWASGHISVVNVDQLDHSQPPMRTGTPGKAPSDAAPY